MNSVTGLPETTTDGHTAIAVSVDRLTKMVHFAPRWNDMRAEEAAQIFMRQIFRPHGITKFLASDRGKLLTFKFSATDCDMLGIN